MSVAPVRIVVRIAAVDADSRRFRGVWPFSRPANDRRQRGFSIPAETLNVNSSGDKSQNGRGGIHGKEA
jgi:hypothetical protein